MLGSELVFEVPMVLSEFLFWRVGVGFEMSAALSELLGSGLVTPFCQHQGLLPDNDWLLCGALGGVQAPPELSRPPPQVSVSQSGGEALSGMVMI